MPYVTRLQKFVAVLLGLSGVASFLYAGFLPVPPFSDDPVPLAGEVLGVLSAVAAVGVYRLQPWGRALGVAVIVVSLLLAVFRMVTRAAEQDPLGVVVSLVLSVTLDGFILWALLRRWPARDPSDK